MKGRLNLIKSFLPVLLCLAGWAGCTPSNPLDVENAWVRPPAGHQASSGNQHAGHTSSSSANRTAAYFTIQNKNNRSDRLLAVTTPAADTVEIHRSWTDEKGIMRMHPLFSVEVLPQQTLAFEPGGYHLMLIGVQPLQVGDSLDLMLHFEQADSVLIGAAVGHFD